MDVRSTIAQCRCGHDPHWLSSQISVGRYVQEYRVVDGEYALVCQRCGGLWDHTATDRLIDLIMEV